MCEANLTYADVKSIDKLQLFKSRIEVIYPFPKCVCKAHGL